jgi:hypothetical protein
VAANAPALVVRFPLCTGSTYSTSTVNQWQAGNFVSATGAVNVLASVTTSSFVFTGVALMVGASAASAEANFKSYADNLLDCMRYFQQWTAFQFAAYTYAVSVTLSSVPLSPNMRAAPTVVQSGMTYSNCSGITVGPPNGTTVQAYLTGATTSTGAYVQGTFKFDADF